MNLKQYKQKALKDPTYRKEYVKHNLAFEIGQTILSQRIEMGYSQKKLAALVKTKQPSIARLENGNSLPSLGFLSKIAKVLGITRMTITF